MADIAEWRIDWYQDVFQPRKRNALAKKIRKNLQGKPLLVTFRSRREGGERDITPTAYQALLDEIIESNSVESVDITEDQIRNMFGRFKEFVLTRNLPECKKFISDYVKEVVVYRDHVEVIFNVVFSFVDNEITHDLHITASREMVK